VGARAGRRTTFFVFFVSLVYTARMHALFKKADEQKETKETKALHPHICAYISEAILFFQFDLV
jgi:hypothetical protein